MTRLIPYAGYDPTERVDALMPSSVRPYRPSLRENYHRPEPGWWARARMLQSEGLDRNAIAKATGKSVFTVANAIDPARREKRKGYERQRYRRAVQERLQTEETAHVR